MPMRNLNTDRAVASHYGSSELTDRILKALGASKAKPPTLAALAQIDQLHHGRLGLTERLVSVAKIERGMHVLDAGSGIGGAARHLASVCGCRVDAIDLTPEFVNTGAELDKLVGLSDSISYRLGSVTDLPYESSSFDVVWSQNVTMNVADKSSMFSEAMRVLRPGGVFAFTHLAQNSEEEVDFPMPWANSKDTSFLGNPVEILATLGQIGFENAVDHTSAFMPLPPPPQAMGQIILWSWGETWGCAVPIRWLHLPTVD